MAIVLIEGFNGYYDAARYLVDTGSVTTVGGSTGSSSLSVVSGVRGLNIVSGSSATTWRQHARTIPSVTDFCAGCTVTNSVADRPFAIANAAETDYLGIYATYGGLVYLRKRVSGSNTDIVTSWPAAHSAARYYELVKVGTNAYLYINGFLAASTTVPDTVTYSKVIFESFAPVAGAYTQRFTNFYLTDDGTRLGPIKILPATINADAENTGFTGNYTSVDEQPTDLVTNANYIWTDADGSRFTAFATAPFTGTALAYRATVGGYSAIDGLYDFRTLVKSGFEETEGADTAAGYDLTYYNWSRNLIAETLPDGSELSVENFEDAEFGVSVTRNPDP